MKTHEKILDWKVIFGYFSIKINFGFFKEKAYLFQFKLLLHWKVDFSF